MFGFSEEWQQIITTVGCSSGSCSDDDNDKKIDSCEDRDSNSSNNSKSYKNRKLVRTEKALGESSTGYHKKSEITNILYDCLCSCCCSSRSSKLLLFQCWY